MKCQESILRCLPEPIRNKAAELLEGNSKVLNEIRLRVGYPAVAMFSSGYDYLDRKYILQSECILGVFERLCEYSVFSHQQELAQGFITLPGGHRVGVCGTASFDRNGNRTIKFISSINIRIAHEYIGCADEIVRTLFSDKISGTLIAGPPCSGKTTLLKDIALKLSSPPFSKKLCIVDERNEIAAMHRGIPQNTVGAFCDVLCGYPKAEGIINSVRALSPEIIICDEMGGTADAEAVCGVLNCGITMISTVHACNAFELYKNPSVKKLLQSGAFSHIVILKGGCSRGEVEEVIEVDSCVI